MDEKGKEDPSSPRRHLPPSSTSLLHLPPAFFKRNQRAPAFGSCRSNALVQLFALVVSPFCQVMHSAAIFLTAPPERTLHQRIFLLCCGRSGKAMSPLQCLSTMRSSSALPFPTWPVVTVVNSNSAASGASLHFHSLRLP
jgi:hypothetical protein